MNVDIRQIPGLAAPALHTSLPTRSVGGLPQVRLPSGHVAAHVTRHADVKAVLADPTFLRACTNTDDGPSYLPTTMPPAMLLNLDMPEHARLKRLTNRLYSAASMAGSRASVRAVLAEFVAGEVDVDLMQDVLVPLTVRVNCRLLGIAEEDIPRFHELSVEMQMASRDDVEHLEAGFATLYSYIEELVEARRAERDGLVSLLLDQGDELEEPLTQAEACAILLGSIVGGDQNILSTLSKVVYVLLAEPQLWEHLVQNPESVPSAVEELLRVLPLGTISTFPRVASRELCLPSGSRIAAGEIVVADVREANLDPEIYPRPTLIDLQRQGPRHVQFGYGIHHCMGAALARLVIGETVRYLIEELPESHLTADPRTLTWQTGVLVHRPVSMPVRLAQEVAA